MIHEDFKNLDLPAFTCHQCMWQAITMDMSPSTNTPTAIHRSTIHLVNEGLLPQMIAARNKTTKHKKAELQEPRATSARATTTPHRKPPYTAMASSSSSSRHVAECTTLYERRRPAPATRQAVPHGESAAIQGA